MQWLEVKQALVKPSTFKEYDRLCRKNLIPAFGQYSLSQIDRDKLQSYLLGFVKEGKHRTAEKLADLLRCIFDVAADDYKIPSPMAKVVLPRYQTKKGSALTYEEEAKLVRYCRENADNAATDAILALLYFGMRQSELATMRVTDGKWLEIETSKERLGQDVVLRRAPFTPMARKVLPLIDFEKARTTNTRTIASTIKRVLPARHVHELRHTYVSRCKECGVSRRSRQHLGGAFPDGYDHFHRLHALFRGVSTKRSGKSKLRLVAYSGRFLLPFYSPISPQSPVFSQNRAKGQCIKIKNMHDFVLFIHKIVHKLAGRFGLISNFRALSGRQPLPSLCRCR